MDCVSVDELIADFGSSTCVVDVRESYEYRAGHLPGAVSIPLGELPYRIAEIPHAQPVYVMCRGGDRSLAAAIMLRAAGYAAVNVDHGIEGWVERGQPIVSSDSA